MFDGWSRSQEWAIIDQDQNRSKKLEQDTTRMMQKFWRWNGLDCRKLDAE